MKFHLRSEQQVFQEESLNGRQYTTRSTLILVNAIFDILIEKEALSPRVVNVPLAIFKQKMGNAVGFLSANNGFFCVLSQPLPRLRVDIQNGRLLLVELWA